MSNFFKNEECYEIIGICMEIHRILGPGLNEVVYKDAMEYEFKNRGIPFEREKKFEVVYKGIVLSHYYFADFVAFEDIILEVKAVNDIHKEHIKQTLNYISIAKAPLGLVLNFGAQSFQQKRVIN